jgi:hypothetical protein
LHLIPQLARKSYEQRAATSTIFHRSYTTTTPRMSAEPIKDVPATEPVVVEPAGNTPVPAVDAQPTTETPALATEPEATTDAATPVTEGTLGYKGPGLIK